MERYLIALDLDGTTLNADGQLSAGTIAVLREAQAAGHLVVITTGRPDSISEHFYDDLQLHGPMINFNGALIHIRTNTGVMSKRSPFPFRWHCRYGS